ncbi:MAG: NADP-dependent oxidoreductase [Ginsengibacter sp.]
METSKFIQHINRAIRYHHYGGSEVLQLENLPVPELREDALLIKIKASGVNPIDWKLREGMRTVKLPYIPGVEASGVIMRIGKAVKGRKIGEPVYGAVDCSYAQYAVAEAKHVFPKPPRLSFEQAAAVGGGKTAWGALFQLAQLKKGQRVLIHGASGGVGVFAVQLARLAGAYVIATSSSKNIGALQALGAHEVVDYHNDDFEKEIQKVDVVLDAVGGQLLQKSYALVKQSGVLLSIVEPPSQENAEHFGIRALWGGTKTISSMIEVDRRLQSGGIKPVISKIFVSLKRAADAQDYSQNMRKEMGKIVLKIN